MKKKYVVLAVAAMLVAALTIVLVRPSSRYTTFGLLRGEAFAAGMPRSYWADALSHPDPEVREEASSQLNHIGSEARDEVPALRQALKDERTRVRVNASQTLYKIGADSRPAIPELIVCLKDENSWVRINAALALGKIGPDALEAVPALIAALRDEANVPQLFLFNLSVREGVALTLGRIGPEAREAVPALTQALKSPDETGDFHRRVTEALQFIDPDAARAGVP